MVQRRRLLILGLVLALPRPALAAAIPITIYRNPNCGCCDAYAHYLEGQGFAVELIDTYDAASMHRKYGVPQSLEGCHTAVAGGYVFEGLVPARYVRDVIQNHRPIHGLSVPGMPAGAPGMPGEKRAPIHVYYLSRDASPQIFATF